MTRSTPANVSELLRDVDGPMPDLSDLASAFAAVLDALPQPILLVDADATVRHANRAAMQFLGSGSGLVLDDDRLCVADPVETARLHRAVATLAAARGSSQATVVVLRRARPLSPLQLVLARPESALPSAARRVALFVCDPEQRIALSEPVLRQLYGLTRTEARVAALLAEGDSVQEAAQRLGVEESTARTHLKRVLAKTGTTRQAALVRLLLIGPARLHGTI